MKIDALYLKPAPGGGASILRTQIEADPEALEEGSTEPRYESVKEFIGGWIEHLEVAPGIHVWCDEEFRLKEQYRFTSAIVYSETGAYYDFGGPVIVTGPSAEALLTWAIARLRIPGEGRPLDLREIEVAVLDQAGEVFTMDKDGNLKKVGGDS